LEAIPEPPSSCQALGAWCGIHGQPGLVRGFYEGFKNMVARLEDLEKAEATEGMSDAELYRKYESPEALRHFKEKYPAGCWEREDYERDC
jgi:hypothetical protein